MNNSIELLSVVGLQTPRICTANGGLLHHISSARQIQSTYPSWIDTGQNTPAHPAIKDSKAIQRAGRKAKPSRSVSKKSSFAEGHLLVELVSAREPLGR